jgi:hypothetical protein
MAATHALGGEVTSQTMTGIACTIAQVEAAGAVLLTMIVPSRCTILDVILTVTDMDSSTGLLIDVGDSAGPATPDDNRFIAAHTGQAAGSIRSSDSAGALPGTYTYRGLKDTDDNLTDNQEIEVTVNTVATTGVAGTVSLTVEYFVHA